MFLCIPMLRQKKKPKKHFAQNSVTAAFLPNQTLALKNVRCEPTGNFCLLVMLCFLNFFPVWGDPEKQEAMKEGLYYETKMCV